MISATKPRVKLFRNKYTDELVEKVIKPDYFEAKKILLEDYYRTYEMHKDSRGPVFFNPYGVSGFYSVESYYKGGLREDLYSRFIRFEMAKKFNISVTDWFNLLYSEAMKQLDIAKSIWEIELESKKTIIKESEKEMQNSRI